MKFKCPGRTRAYVHVAAAVAAKWPPQCSSTSGARLVQAPNGHGVHCHWHYLKTTQALWNKKTSAKNGCDREVKNCLVLPLPPGALRRRMRLRLSVLDCRSGDTLSQSRSPHLQLLFQLFPCRLGLCVSIALLSVFPQFLHDFRITRESGDKHWAQHPARLKSEH
jgi:hypothetical protein